MKAKNIVENRFISNDYLFKCILKALDHPKLSKVDVSQIFQIDLQTVIKISRQQNFETIVLYPSKSQESSNIMKEITPQKYLSCLKSQFESKIDLFSQKAPLMTNKIKKIEKKFKQLNKEDLQRQSLKILSKFPPYRINNQLRAIVQILKQNPKVIQKDIIDILSKKYDIKNVNQTKISRLLKKIYDIKNSVDILNEAKNLKIINF